MRIRWLIAAGIMIAATAGLYFAWQLSMFPIFGPAA